MNVLIVAPFMHKSGHFTTFPADLARGFGLNGAAVTLLTPFEPAVSLPSAAPWRTVCLASEQTSFSRFMAWIWSRFQHAPILLALAWITCHTRKGDYDLVYWTDFLPDNQQSVWPLAWARLLGLYRHRTAFTEHHHFNWQRHRLSRRFKLDRLRLAGLCVIVHSRALLDALRKTMAWPDKARYIPWGLWPTPASEMDRAEARARLEIPSSSRVLLVFGIQAIRRKEIDTLADALRTLPLAQPLVVVFAGLRTHDAPHPFDAPELQAKPGLTVYRHEHFLSDDDVRTQFAAADAVWAYYGNFLGASGVLMQAIAHGRLALCAQFGESGALARERGIGLLPDTDDLPGVADLLARFVSLPSSEQAAFETAAREAAHALAWPEVTRQILEHVPQPG